MSTTSQASEPDSTMWASVLHSGLAGSFLRSPYVPPEAAAIRAAGAGAAFYGMPWDSTSIGRTGANYGPRGMRDVSAQFLDYNATWDFSLRDALHPVDCGDATVVLANAEKTFANAEHDISQIIEGGAIPVVLGGDHSVTIPSVRAVKAAHANPGLVLVDTHLDTAMDVGGEQLNHCCPITRAVDAGFDPTKIALVGISGWLNPRAEMEYCREHGITVIWLEDIWKHGAAAAAERAVAVAGVGTDGIYLSFDIDALDGAYAPGTCVSTPAGMTPREALEIVWRVAGAGLVGLDLAEVAPSLDPTFVTSSMGIRVVLDALAAHAGALR
jgi:agmatinase